MNQILKWAMILFVVSSGNVFSAPKPDWSKVTTRVLSNSKIVGTWLLIGKQDKSGKNIVSRSAKYIAFSPNGKMYSLNEKEALNGKFHTVNRREYWIEGTNYYLGDRQSDANEIVTLNDQQFIYKTKSEYIYLSACC